MSINSSLGQGMAELFGDAVLARTIRNSVEEREGLREELKKWKAHAGQLKDTVNLLHGIVKEQSAVIQRLEGAELTLTQERDQLLDRNAKLKEGEKEFAELLSKQVDYMCGLKRRLAQTEKSLRHSSGLSVGLGRLKDFLLHATRAVDNHELLSQQAMDVMERAYDQFIETGQLTPDEEMQRVLDELKAKAPDIKKGVFN